MSNPSRDEEQATELDFGGRMQGDGDEQSYHLEQASGDGRFKWGPISAGGRFHGPAGLAPLGFVIGATISGGIIWAASAWQAGSAVMTVSFSAYLIYILRTPGRRERD